MPKPRLLRKQELGTLIKVRKLAKVEKMQNFTSVSYTHLRAHETKANLVCRLLLEKKKKKRAKGVDGKKKKKK